MNELWEASRTCVCQALLPVSCTLHPYLSYTDARSRCLLRMGASIAQPLHQGSRCVGRDESPPLPTAPTFAATAINFEPKTVCLDHTDRGNSAVGWCSLSGCGRFDYRKGGRLVLWDLELLSSFLRDAPSFFHQPFSDTPTRRFRKGKKGIRWHRIVAGGYFAG